MKLSKDDLQEIMAVIEQAEEFRPFIKSIVETVLSFGPELKPITESFCKYIVQKRIASIKAYCDAGFTKDDAITMTLDDVFAVRRISQNINNQNRSK